MVPRWHSTTVHYGAMVAQYDSSLWCHGGTVRQFTMVPWWHSTTVHYGATVAQYDSSLWCHGGTGLRCQGSLRCHCAAVPLFTLVPRPILPGGYRVTRGTDGALDTALRAGLPGVGWTTLFSHTGATVWQGIDSLFVTLDNIGPDMRAYLRPTFAFFFQRNLA